MKKKMIWVAGILIATSAYAQTDVSTGIMRGKDYGVTYLLPKTEIEIVVPNIHTCPESSVNMPTATYA